MLYKLEQYICFYYSTATSHELNALQQSFNLLSLSYNTFYILTRRYIFSSCQEASDHARKQIQTAAAQVGLLMKSPLISKTDDHSYTFRDCNRRSLDLLTHGNGKLFPAVTTYHVLEFVHYVAHLSLCIMVYFFLNTTHTHTNKHTFSFGVCVV